MQHIFRYIIGTFKFRLQYGGKTLRKTLYCYADAAYADNLLSRRSTAGYIVFLGGGLVLWKSKKQTMVTLSTLEAEFINLTPAGLALLWINNMLTEFGKGQESLLLLYTDSQNARQTVLNKLNSARTRHIDIKYKWVIEKVEEKKF